MDVPQGMREWEGIISLSVGQCVIFCCQLMEDHAIWWPADCDRMVPSLELAEGTRFIIIVNMCVFSLSLPTGIVHSVE